MKAQLSLSQDLFTCDKEGLSHSALLTLAQSLRSIHNLTKEAKERNIQTWQKDNTHARKTNFDFSSTCGKDR